MKISMIILATLGQGFALPSTAHQHLNNEWRPPCATDEVRGPCPMLNTLANHGFLPRDGKDININQSTEAFNAALNFAPDLASQLQSFGIQANPEPNATIFSLDMLSRHNILEHDASLSREDFFFNGDAHTFKQYIFDQTRSYWGPQITIKMGANAKLSRVIDSQNTNPTYTMTATGTKLAFGETAAYLLTFGNKTTGTATRKFVEYLFENERLPWEIGWVKRDVAIGRTELFTWLNLVINATGVSPDEAARMAKKADWHVPILE